MSTKSVWNQQKFYLTGSAVHFDVRKSKRPIEDEDDDENDYDSLNAWEPYYGLSYMP